MSRPPSAPASAERSTDPVDRWIAVGVWLGLAALVAWSAWQRWTVLDSSPYPVGIDGYYYAIQVRSVLEHGHLAYPAAPLTFWLMAPLAALTDPIIATKLIAAGVGALVAVPAFLLGRRLGGVAGGLLAAVLAVTGGGSFYLSLEFVKNGVGLTVALTAAWLGARALERPTRTRVIAAAAGLVAALLAHKMSALLAGALLIPAAVVELRGRALPAPTWRVLGAVAAGLVAALVIAGLAAPARFAGPDDLALLGDMFDGEARWDLPALVVHHGRGPDYVLDLGGQGWIAAAAGLALAGAVLIQRRWPALAGTPSAAGRARPADRAMAWAALAVLAISAAPWLAVADPDGLGFRMRVAMFAPATLVWAAAAGRWLAPVEARLRVAVVVTASLVWLAARPAAPTDGLVRAQVPMVAAMQALPGTLPDGAVVITAERDLGFMAAWYARVPVRLRPDPVPPERRWRMIPLAMIGMGSPLDQVLRDARAAGEVAPPIGLHPGHPNGLVLVPEATWEWILARLPPGPARWWREWHTI